MPRGKSKGNEFERKICKTLSLWFSDGEDDDIFWRTSGSGARASTRAKKGKKTKYDYGDVTFTNPKGQEFIDFFLIEVKIGYTETNPLDFLDTPKKATNNLKNWWEKAEKERIFGQRNETLIIFKRDRKRICCMISEKMFFIILDLFGKRKIEYIAVKLSDKTLVILDFYALFELLDSTALVKYIKEDLHESEVNLRFP